MWMDGDGRPRGDISQPVRDADGVAASGEPAPSCVLAIRSPARDRPELIISHRGHKAQVIGMTLSQCKHFNYELAKIIADWPE